MTSFSGDAKAKFMEVALNLSRRVLPACRPNPPVGCVIVGQTGLVSDGYTGAPGEPHAEASAIASLPPGAVRPSLAAFVTLEPCAFHGRTPPCVHALIHSGISAVYVGIVDPDPLSSGTGLRALKDAGVHVELGILEHEVRSFLAPYLRPANFDKA